jgi:hypothetical protein
MAGKAWDPQPASSRGAHLPRLDRSSSGRLWRNFPALSPGLQPWQAPGVMRARGADAGGELARAWARRGAAREAKWGIVWRRVLSTPPSKGSSSAGEIRAVLNEIVYGS